MQPRNGCKSAVTLPHAALAASLLQLGSHLSLLKNLKFNSFIHTILHVSIKDKIIAVSWQTSYESWRVVRYNYKKPLLMNSGLCTFLQWVSIHWHILLPLQLAVTVNSEQCLRLMCGLKQHKAFDGSWTSCHCPWSSEGVGFGINTLTLQPDGRRKSLLLIPNEEVHPISSEWNSRSSDVFDNGDTGYGFLTMSVEYTLTEVTWEDNI